LAGLEAQDHLAVEDLLGVAKVDELPWLKLYTSRTDLKMSLQREMDEAEAQARRTDRANQRAYRPKNEGVRRRGLF